MAQANGCVRIDEDETQGGFWMSSTIQGNDAKVFYTYEEMFHFFERVELGYFSAVADLAREKALRFGTVELTPLTAEHAAPVTAAA